MDIEISHRIQQLGNGSLAIYGTVVSPTGIVTITHFVTINALLQIPRMGKVPSAVLF